MWLRQLGLGALLTLAIAACGDDPGGTTTGTTIPTGTGGEGGSGGAGGEGPGPAFDAFCAGRDWRETLADATLGELHGDYVGVLQSSQIVAGTMEGQKLVPEHPFEVRAVRIAFAGTGGPVRIRLMETYGRSFPWPWPDTSDTAHDLMPPIELEVAAPDPEVPIDIPLPAPVYLLPSQHYILVYEHLAPQPLLAVEGVPAAERQPERDYSRAGIFFPATKDGGGIGGTPDHPSVNYRVELRGATFCPVEDRAFARVPSPFDDEPSSYLTVADVDADGDDDLVIYVAGRGASAYLNDGAGQFSLLPDAFADAPEATMLVFGDVDDDGDRDAFAATWVQVDADSDGVDVISEGDCNNAPEVGASVRPGAPEIMGNGKDDDCDGVADDGSDGSDADGDGYSIADGDCDDTEPESFPGNPERLDMLDNDCNLAVDEIFVNKLLLNDGSGHFSALPASGVEVIDPSTSGAFGDGNGDGVLDLYWGNWLYVYPEDPSVPDRYFTGNGDGTFSDAQAAAGLVLPKALSAFGVMWSDYDDDADLDILVTNYHLYDNQLWQNDGSGVFSDVAPLLGIHHDDVPSGIAKYPGGHTFGADFGDIDNDGDMDLYLANLSHPRNMPLSDPSQLMVSSGAPEFGFSEERQARGLIYDEGDANAAFADYDNDGDLDLLVVSLYESHFTRLYRNDGDRFADVTYEAGVAVRDAVSAAWSDVDHDGDLDLFVSDRGGAPYVHLFENRVGQDRAWVAFELEGVSATRDAVGARVRLRRGGVTQQREVRDGGGHGNAQQSHVVHFGLGDDETIDEVEVRWLGGSVEIFRGVAARGRYRLVQGSGVATPM